MVRLKTVNKMQNFKNNSIALAKITSKLIHLVKYSYVCNYKQSQSVA